MSDFEKKEILEKTLHLKDLLPEAGPVKELTFDELAKWPHTNQGYIGKLDLAFLAACLFFGGNFKRNRIYSNWVEDRIVEEDGGVGWYETNAIVYLESGVGPRNNLVRGSFEVSIEKSDDPLWPFYFDISELKFVLGDSVDLSRLQ